MGACLQPTSCGDVNILNSLLLCMRVTVQVPPEAHEEFIDVSGRSIRRTSQTGTA